MSFVSKLLSPFYFTRFPATILAVIFYAFVFESVLYSNYLPPVNKSEAFDRALVDLSTITARPHPYLSHENDHVRSYLLSRIQSLSPDLEIIDDLNSTVKYAAKSRQVGVYFEGTNILVKVTGSGRNDSEAVLFSAHFDSVPVAPGATDNGIGVVGTLQLLEYLVGLPVDKRPQRTAIFNFNNDEEDGLYGAHVYLVHPWANLTTTFLNIDGAGAGGRPMLFRSTSMSVTAAFIRAHPKTGYYHTNVVSQDVFGKGVIKSGTDWQVYGEYMDGLDLAFYKNRAFYHTKFDSLAYAEGGARALQAMIESIKSGGLGLLNAPANDNDAHKNSVHFDVLGRFLVIMEMGSMFIINVVFLVVGPVILLVLFAIDLTLARKRGTGPTRSETGSPGTKIWRGIKALLGGSQFWLSFIISVAAQIGLVIGFISLNPFIVHSHPTLVLSSVLLLAYLTIVMTITALQSTGISATKSKIVSLASLYTMTWVLLVISTVYLCKSKIGGTYWVTIWNACSFAGLLVSLIQSMIGRFTEGKMGGGDATVYEEVAGDVSDGRQDGTRKYVRGLEHQAEPRGDEERVRDPEIRETQPTEITPLMHQHRDRRSGEVVSVDVPGYASSKGEDEIGWWILQMVLTLPLPALFVYELGTALLDSLSQTLVDGSSPLIVYAAVCILGTFIMLPLTPFAHRMHILLTSVVLIAFLIITLFCWMVFPFTQTSPMKFSFRQSVELDTGNSLMIQRYSPSVFNIKATTSITGLGGYVNEVVASLPSAKQSEVSCVSTGSLTTCKWEVGEELLPSPGGYGADGTWLETEVTRLNESSAALISVKGRNTRGCRIDLDTAVHEYEVREVDGQGWAGQVPRGYNAVPRDGVKEILLWSRTWDRKFEVKVLWKEAKELSGRIACDYAEYASGAAGGNTPGKVGKIPAFEEVSRFAPRWATVTKGASGLVEVSTRFTV